MAAPTDYSPLSKLCGQWNQMTGIDRPKLVRTLAAATAGQASGIWRGYSTYYAAGQWTHVLNKVTAELAALDVLIAAKAAEIVAAGGTTLDCQI